MGDAIIEQVRHLARKFAKSAEMLAVEGEHRFADSASDAAQALDACIAEIERLRTDLARVTQERDEARAIVHMLPDDVLAKARRLVEAAEAAREGK